MIVKVNFKGGFIFGGYEVYNFMIIERLLKINIWFFIKNYYLNDNFVVYIGYKFLRCFYY